jgi:hypothetical protein
MRRGSMLLADVLLVLAISAVTHGWAAAHNRAHIDERDWTARTYFYRLAFINGDVSHRLWSEYAAIDQPHVTEFLIGGVFELAGQKIPPVPRHTTPWLSQSGPPPGRLRVARIPGAVLGAMVAVWVYAIGVLATGRRVAGVVAGLVYACHSLTVDCQPMAMSDAPLMFFSTLAVLAAVWAIGPAARPGEILLAAEGRGPSEGEAPPPGKTPDRRRILLAVAPPCIGLAVGSKLTGIFCGLTVGILVVLFVRFGDYGRKVAYLILFVLLTEASVIAVNPTLYLDPSGRFLAMLDHRVKHAEGQSRRYPKVRLDGLHARLGAVYTRLAKGTGTWPTQRLSVVLACVGAVALVARAARGRAGGPGGPGAAAILIWSSVLMIGLAPSLPLNWGRYYLPFLPCWSLLVGAGAGEALAAARWVLGRPGGEWSRRRARCR